MREDGATLQSADAARRPNPSADSTDPAIGAPRARTDCREASGACSGAGAHPEPVKTRGSDPLLTLIGDYLRLMLEQIRHEEARVRESADPDAVHKMRVAIRRTRSVLRTFDHLFPGDKAESLNGELHWLAGMLGEVRDADVHQAAIDDFQATLPDDAAVGLQPYLQHVKDAHSQARAALLAAMTGERYVALLDQLDNLVASGPEVGVLRRYGDLLIADCAASSAATGVRKILKRGRRIASDSPAEKLHRLRIEGKRLRYLLEFFSEAQPKRWRSLLKALRELQNVLGEYQDARVALERAGEFARKITPDRNTKALLLALGRLEQYEQQRMVTGRAQFAEVWKRFEKTCG
jgi:CHAD domain-containing protein